ncbi:MAG: Uma2 family endonuclease [Pseudanabaena sp. RU_4_16]|nr:Uma2 family endonuclease [Pseudanabaena sp. RU_4_16]
MTISASSLDALATIEYPEEDDLPMPEGDAQREYLSYATQVLRVFFQERQDVYVSGNLFIYYEQGNTSANVAPDTFVVFGADNHNRGSYKVWEEGGKLPEFVLEITSENTATRDKRDKPALYQKLGIKEYFQYDPTGKYLKLSSLQGKRLENGNYIEIEASTLPDGTLSLFSETLNLELRLYPDKGLRFYDRVSNELLRSYEELEQARLIAERIAKQERKRVDRLTAYLQSLGINPDEVC